MEKSSYVQHPKRLADVISALQVMGTYFFASRTVDKWEESFGRKPLSAKNWEQLFTEHPEFFRIVDGKASLMWRRAKRKLYFTHSGEEISKDEYESLSSDEKKKVSRAPLEPSQVESLINSAVNLHAAAISHSKEMRWWMPLMSASIGLIGVLLGALLPYLLDLLKTVADLR